MFEIDFGGSQNTGHESGNSPLCRIAICATTPKDEPTGLACGLLDVTPEFIAHGGEQLVGERRLSTRAETFVERGRKDRSRHSLVDCSLDRPASFPRVGDPARKVIERRILGQRRGLVSPLEFTPKYRCYFGVERTVARRLCFFHARSRLSTYRRCSVRPMANMAIAISSGLLNQALQ
jgi:hypothetical protein